MKNLYLIVTPTIKLVGGSQIYSLNKLHYYERKGWQTLFLHANISGEIVIDEMNKYKDDYVDEFKFFSFVFKKNRVKTIISNLKTKYSLKDFENIIIESHTPETASWCELVAEQLNAKHIVFLLSEFPKIKPFGLYDFYIMKLLRGELAGINDSSIQILFDGYKKIDGRKYSLPAFCSNVIGYPNKHKMPTFSKYDYLLCSLGRMEKPFLLDAVNEIVEFAKLHRHIKIAILFIGDGDAHIKNIIKEKLSKADNIQFQITGPLYPIPINLIEKPDLFFGVAGACRVSGMVGKLTVTFDVNDCKPIGLLGVTTDNTCYRNNAEPLLKFSVLLEEILINKKYREHLKHVDIDAMNAISFASHDDFLYKSNPSKEYYNILEVRLSKKEIIKKILITILGVNLLFDLKNKFLR